MKFQLLNSRRDKIIILIFVIFYVTFGFLAFFFQAKIIYHPNQQDFITCPAFATSEKLDLNGTRAYFKRNGPNIVIFYHGNAGSACDRGFIADIFEANSYSFLFPEYTGYSNDTRKPAHDLLKNDVKNIVEYLKNQKYQEIVVAGESIGAGLASYHVSLSAPDKVLLISPFSSLLDIAKNRFWFFPVNLITDNAFINTELLKNFKKEIFIIHGEEDTIIPQKLGQKLFDSLDNQNKKIIVIPEAGHNDLFNFSEMEKAIQNFLNPLR